MESVGEAHSDITSKERQHALVRLTWKSEPNAILIDEGIWNRRPRSSDFVPIPGTDLDVDEDEAPGILEWSLDHHVLTLPFISRGNTYARYQRQLDTVRGLLTPDSRLAIGVNANLDYPTAEHSGLDLPLHSESVMETLASLVHEMGLLCNDRSNSYWERSWHEIARCLLVMGHQCATEQERHVTFSELGHINFSRCAEYDRRVVDQRPVTRSDYSGKRGTGTPRGVLPYAAIDDQLESYYNLLDSERGRFLKAFAKVELSPDEEEQIRCAAKHVGHLMDTIQDGRTSFYAEASPGMKLDLRQHHINKTMGQFKARIDQYPLEDIVDAAMTVIVEDFHHTLESHIASAQDLQDHILFFKRFEDDSAGIRFHLPVLLVKHEEDGNKQGDDEEHVAEDDEEDDGDKDEEVDVDEDEEVDIDEDEEDSAGEDAEDGTEEDGDKEYSYKEDNGDSRKTTSNVQRMGCISAVHFLAAFGIKDFPIYGLTTYGSRSSLCQAWYSEADSCCYIVDQIPAKDCFDIAEKDGIMQYMTFLGKMKAHAEELRSRFESVRQSVVEKLSTSEGRQSLQWTFHAQIKQYGL